MAAVSGSTPCVALLVRGQRPPGLIPTRQPNISMRHFKPVPADLSLSYEIVGKCRRSEHRGRQFLTLCRLYNERRRNPDATFAGESGVSFRNTDVDSII